MFRGILQQVDEHLDDLNKVDPQGGEIHRQVDLQRMVMGLCFRATDRFVDNLGEVVPGELGLKGTRLDP